MSLHPIPRPERAEGTVLAALLSALLGVMALVQFMLPQDRPIVPATGPLATQPGAAQIAAVSADPVLARRAIFQPTRQSLAAGAGSNGNTMALGPLGGATPAGIVRVRGAARLILQTATGAAVTLRPGQSWQGWRLTSIGRDEVRFRRGGETFALALGAAANSFSDPGFNPSTYDPRGFVGGYRPNQADEQ